MEGVVGLFDPQCESSDYSLFFGLRFQSLRPHATGFQVQLSLGCTGCDHTPIAAHGTTHRTTHGPPITTH